MEIKIYNNLPVEAKFIREEVFVKEQKFQNEIDSIDSLAIHLVAFDEDKPIATCNYYYNKSKKSYILRRLAVLKEYRQKQIGSKLIETVEDLIKNNGGGIFSLHAQYQLQAYYEKKGFIPIGDIDYDEGYPHLWMKKVIKN